MGRVKESELLEKIKAARDEVHPKLLRHSGSFVSLRCVICLSSRSNGLLGATEKECNKQRCWCQRLRVACPQDFEFYKLPTICVSAATLSACMLQHANQYV